MSEELEVNERFAKWCIKEFLKTKKFKKGEDGKTIHKELGLTKEDLEDLLAVAQAGYIKAIKKFDASLGNKLETYAKPIIHHDLNAYWKTRNKNPIGDSVKTLKSGKEISTEEKLGIEFDADAELKKASEEKALNTHVWKREREIYKLVQDGTPREEIAKLYDIDVKKVYNITQKVKKKIEKFSN